MTRRSPRTVLPLLLIGMVSCASILPAQTLPPLLTEGFDTVPPPLLPGGWTSSAARDPGGDFLVAASGARSAPGCVVSSNATVEQTLTSPALDLGDWRECSLSWFERRSSSHDATFVLEASADGGAGFFELPGGVLPPPGGTSYVGRRVPLPASLEGMTGVLLRWRVAGDGAGATGTIRLDDIALTGRPRSDAAMLAGTLDPVRPLAGEEFRCAGKVLNTGFSDLSGIRIDWGIDADANGIMEPGEARGSTDIGIIAPGESAAWEFPLVREASGSLSAMAIVLSPSDMVAANDTAIFRLPAAVAPHALVINEIMYDPLPGKAEYVEIFNRSGESVEIGGWRLTDDREDSAGGSFTEPGILLGPDAYLLCSPDTALAAGYPGIPPGTPIVAPLRNVSLNNTGDLLLLFDGSGALIDSVPYVPAWHTPVLDAVQGRSLERIETAHGDGASWNWGTSAGASGGTPGERNSLAAGAVESAEGLVFSPNPFSPDGDGFEDVTVIGFRIGGVSAVARVRIYDREGRLVRTLTGSSYVAGSGSFVWNGYDDRGRKVPIGIYVVLLDAVDGSGTEALTARGVVVAAGRL